MTLHPGTLTYVTPPTITGSVEIAVGSLRWTVAPDSAVVHHKLGTTLEVVLVRTPSGSLHALVECEGEVAEVLFPTAYVRDQAARAFFGDLPVIV